MSTNHDDPRLTAYALGELNAIERAAIDQQIGESVETLLEIEAIREVAGQLRAALREESVGATGSLARSANEENEEFAATLSPPSDNDNHSQALRAGLVPSLASVSTASRQTPHWRFLKLRFSRRHLQKVRPLKPEAQAKL